MCVSVSPYSLPIEPQQPHPPTPCLYSDTPVIHGQCSPFRCRLPSQPLLPSSHLSSKFPSLHRARNQLGARKKRYTPRYLWSGTEDPEFIKAVDIPPSPFLFIALLLFALVACLIHQLPFFSFSNPTFHLKGSPPVSFPRLTFEEGTTLQQEQGVRQTTSGGKRTSTPQPVDTSLARHVD